MAWSTILGVLGLGSDTRFHGFAWIRSHLDFRDPAGVVISIWRRFGALSLKTVNFGGVT
jgi:type IV secretory pathway VirB2 component (pilin)